MMQSGVVVLAAGNRSRGDDAIGPLLLERLACWLAAAGRSGEFDLIDDYQLQIEHALDLQGRRLALFIDAGWRTPAPLAFYALAPAAADAGAAPMRCRRRPCCRYTVKSPSPIRRRHSCCVCAASDSNSAQA